LFFALHDSDDDVRKIANPNGLSHSLTNSKQLFPGIATNKRDAPCLGEIFPFVKPSFLSR
jgi:hypothetical protein